MSSNCACKGSCSQQCRNDRAALRRVNALQAKSRMARQGPRRRVNANGRPRLRPTAARILGALLKRPRTNRALLDIGGFRYSARVNELREAGHVIHCTAPGPTPGVRLYTLVP